MSRMRAASLMLVLAVILVAAGWSIWGTKSKTETAQEIPAEECNSCSARHKNLTRLRDAKSLTDLPGE